MQVSLNETEVRQAVNVYIRERLRLSPEEQVIIEMVATRGADGGCKAVIEITEPVSSTTPPAVAIRTQAVVTARSLHQQPNLAATPEPQVQVEEPAVVEVAVDAGGDVLVEQPPAQPPEQQPVKRQGLFTNLKQPH